MAFTRGITFAGSASAQTARQSGDRLIGSRSRPRLLLLLVLSAWLPALLAQTAHRPPAVPLVTHDPYFSVWSFTDRLTDGPTRHWTGTAQPMASLVRVDGKAYRVMGALPSEVPALPQQSVTVAATHTDYAFEGEGIHLDLAFFTPAFPQDLEIMSRPVTYVTWTVRATDAAPHRVELMLDVDPVIAVNKNTEPVIWGRSMTSPFKVRAPEKTPLALRVLSVGTRSQVVLGQSGDNMRINWGFFHLAVPEGELLPGPGGQAGTMVNAAEAVSSFVASGALPAADDPLRLKSPNSGAAHLAVEFALGQVTDVPVTRHVLVAYTDGYGIEYMQTRLRSYWQRDKNTTDPSMLEAAEAGYRSLDARGRTYDASLGHDLEDAGGPNYARLAILAYRQTIAAHKLVADADGVPLWFEKENFSNGDTGTVDVIYPASPFSLFFNPTLLEAEMEPVLRYASMPRWKFPFAPHDIGQYPLANGQTYGGGERTEVDQMPVEESGNLLLLADALAHAQGNAHVAEKYWPLLTKWADYLRDKGLDPENQLSTDDFAGHLAHNANLSIKAIEAIAAYADLAGRLGHADAAHEYRGVAEAMVPRWIRMAEAGDHTRLAFDKRSTWSQKYNLVWDSLLGLKLFPADVAAKEVRFYLKHENRYGLPLDSRKTYTKLDWEVWSATLAQSPADFGRMMVPLGRWLDEGPSRVPLTDWYDTITGKQQQFQARSVVGGIYIKALKDEQLAQKWRAQKSVAGPESAQLRAAAFPRVAQPFDRR